MKKFDTILPVEITGRQERLDRHLRSESLGRPLMTPDEVALELRVALKAVHRLCREGRLSYIKINERGERRFAREQIEEFLKIQTVQSPKALDTKPSVVLPYPQKGGEKRKSVGVNGSGLVKEMKELCRSKS